MLPDIKTLNSLGEFLTIYGGWGVSILLGVFIMFLFKYFGSKLKDKDSEIQKRDLWWVEERKKINITFEEHRKESMQVIEKFTKAMASIGSKSMQCRDSNNEVCKLIGIILDSVTKGIIKIPKITDREEESLTTFLEGNK